MSVEKIKNYLSEQYHLPLEQVETMMPSFIAALRSHMDRLEIALSENNLVQMGKAGHTIKGAFLNLGLAECAGIALDIEESGKAENSSVDYRSKLDSLHRHLEPVFTSE